MELWRFEPSFFFFLILLLNMTKVMESAWIRFSKTSSNYSIHFRFKLFSVHCSLKSIPEDFSPTNQTAWGLKLERQCPHGADTNRNVVMTFWWVDSLFWYSRNRWKTRNLADWIVFQYFPNLKVFATLTKASSCEDLFYPVINVS